MANTGLHTVSPATISMGPIPFDLYASNNNAKVVLFCRRGFPITQRHKDILGKAERRFFVMSGQVDKYHEYAQARFDQIIESDQLKIDEKVNLVKSIGNRLLSNLYSDPRSKNAMAQSGQFVEGYMKLVLKTEVAINSLFTIGTTSSFALTHSINVSTFCLLLGRILYGDQEEVLQSLALGGLVLDIGMCLLDKASIERRGLLKRKEKWIIQQHPMKSTELIAQHGISDDVVAMARSHHERADGSGYPDGLRLDDIHPYARIAAVADVYDAMTSARSYRKALSPVKALYDFSQNKHLYDEKVLRALFSLVLQNEDLVETFLEGNPSLQRIAAV